MNSIDIDVGGTFTDMVLNFDGQTFIRKVPTTPTIFRFASRNVIQEGAETLWHAMEGLLPDVDMIRYSTTIALNRLLERKGPRLGLITTEGHEDTVLLGRGAQWIDGTRVQERRNLSVQNKPDPLIPREHDRRGEGADRLATGSDPSPLNENDVRSRRCDIWLARGHAPLWSRCSGDF